MSLQTPEKIRALQRKLYALAKEKPTQRFYLLYDKVYRDDILDFAYRTCRANGGAPGVDGVRFEDIESEGLEEWRNRLASDLREKTYHPSPVRRVMIPKPGGGERPLGIPTIRDRVVQTAAKLVLEPIFEADFESSAHGYRPGRSAVGAVKEVHLSLREGYMDVVDADLSKYFDTIPHHELMQSVARRVSDRWMLKLIKAWLKAPVEERDERGKRRMSGGKGSTMGTPQGGVISPLLANIYMNRFLRAWRERRAGEYFRARIVNYADDFVILSRGNAAGAMKWMRGAMASLKLTVNESKTCLRDARQESFNFLGYTFGPRCYRRTGQWYTAARPSEKAVARAKQAVRDLLRPGNMKPWPEVALRLERMLCGWSNYFQYGSARDAKSALRAHVFERVSHFLRRRKVSRWREKASAFAAAMSAPLGLRATPTGGRATTPWART